MSRNTKADKASRRDSGNGESPTKGGNSSNSNNVTKPLFVTGGQEERGRYIESGGASFWVPDYYDAALNSYFEINADRANENIAKTYVEMANQAVTEAKKAVINAKKVVNSAKEFTSELEIFRKEINESEEKELDDEEKDLLKFINKKLAIIEEQILKAIQAEERAAEAAENSKKAVDKIINWELTSEHGLEIAKDEAFIAQKASTAAMSACMRVKLAQDDIREKFRHHMEEKTSLKSPKAREDQNEEEKIISQVSGDASASSLRLEVATEENLQEYTQPRTTFMNTGDAAIRLLRYVQSFFRAE